VYAIVSWWQLPEERCTESVIELEPAIITLARHQPDFMEAFWTYERSNGKSIGFMLVRTSEGAHEVRNAVESHMETCAVSSVQLEMIRAQKIVGHVPAASAGGETAPFDTLTVRTVE
jgi:hypothetical protein